MTAALFKGAVITVAAASVTVAATDLVEQQSRRVQRGRYLVSISACHDCHSPKADAQGSPDLSRPLSGRPQTTRPPDQDISHIKASLDLTAWAGPWGVSYAINLTPDASGLGNWGAVIVAVIWIAVVAAVMLWLSRVANS